MNGRSALLQLPYFDIIEHSMLDMMHVTSGVLGRHLVPLLRGERLTNAEGAEAQAQERKEEKEMKEHKKRVAAMNKAAAKQRADVKLALSARGSALRDRAAAAAHKRVQKALRRIDVNGDAADMEELAKVDAPVTDSITVELRGAAEQYCNIQRCRFDPAPEQLGEHSSIRQFREAWFVPPAMQLLIEQHCYAKIAAPRGVAPPTKRPLSNSSEMQAHQWVNFARVYGKYLMVHCFPSSDRGGDDSSQLDAACCLLNVVQLCLTSCIEPGFHTTLQKWVTKTAACFQRALPPTEKAVMLHLLLFHMPRTIAYWGPTRGYWNFAYERNLGVLGRYIKRKNTPELTMIKRYQFRKMFPLSIRQIRASHRLVTKKVTDSASDSDSVTEKSLFHPLVPLGAVNSANNKVEKQVFWEKFTKGSTRALFPEDDTRGASHRLQAYVRPMLGDLICDEFKNKGSAFTARGQWSALKIGNMLLTTSRRQEDVAKGYAEVGACNSFFTIACGRVPHYVQDHAEEAGYDPAALLLGKMHLFCKLHMTQWDIHYELGKCTLWETTTDLMSDLLVTDLSLPLKYKLYRESKNGHSRHTRSDEVRYIPLKYIQSLAAIGPDVRGLDIRTKQRGRIDQPVPSTRFFVMKVNDQIELEDYKRPYLPINEVLMDEEDIRRMEGGEEEEEGEEEERKGVEED